MPWRGRRYPSHTFGKPLHTCASVGFLTFGPSFPAQTVYTYPDFVGSEVPEGIADDAPVDLVFPDFVQTHILNTLNDLQSDVTYTDDDVHSYTDVLTNAVLGIYAQKYWN